jgi:hypothetical protein
VKIWRTESRDGRFDEFDEFLIEEALRIYREEGLEAFRDFFNENRADLIRSLLRLREELLASSADLNKIRILKIIDFLSFPP